MPAVKKEVEKQVYNDIISDEVRDYSNDPFVLRKNEQAKEFLRKHPIPEWALKKNDKK